MTLEQFGIVIAILGSIVAVIDAHRKASEALVEQRERFAKLEVKVDTLWSFLLRRAEVEAMGRDIADRNSPLKIRQPVLRMFDSIAPQLREIHAQNPGFTHAELAIEIEKRLGRKIVDDVCHPAGLTEGACLIAAVAVATNSSVVSFQ